MQQVDGGFPRVDSELLGWMTTVRRRLHQIPELGFEEYTTSALVAQTLSNLGLSVHPLGATGLLTVLDSGRHGATVLLRADMDALPIVEQNDHPYRSTRDGVMHACGHDGHMAILLGCARLLRDLARSWVGRIALLFQPAEEGLGGARSIIDLGLLDELRPHFCGGVHLWSELPTSQVAVTTGPFMASADFFDIQLLGVGGHGAVPHHTSDPIVGAAQLVMALQTLVSRRIDPQEACVVTVGALHAGVAANVIPDSAQLSGTVRTFSATTQMNVRQWITDMARTIASALQLEALVSFREIAIPTVNAPKPSEWFRQAVQEGGYTLSAPDFRTMAAEDMSYILKRVPGVFAFVGAGNPTKGATFPHHHPRFEIDEDALAIACEVLTAYAIRAAGQLG